MSKNPEKDELLGRILKGTSAEVKKDSLLSLLVLYLINAGLSRHICLGELSHFVCAYYWNNTEQSQQ